MYLHVAYTKIKNSYRYLKVSADLAIFLFEDLKRLV